MFLFLAFYDLHLYFYILQKKDIHTFKKKTLLDLSNSIFILLFNYLLGYSIFAKCV